MFLILIFALLILFVVYDIVFRLRSKDMIKLSKSLPGPKCIPLLGNGHSFTQGATGLIEVLHNWRKTFGKAYRFWGAYELYVFLSEPEDIEKVLNNSLEKDKQTKLFNEFVGEGLLTSPAPKWKYFRKVINPSFNTQVLNQFCHPMFVHAQTLNKKFLKLVGPEYFDCYDCLYGCTLDILFETNFGIKMNFQTTDRSKYIEYSKGMLTSVAVRVGNFWFHSSLIFKFSSVRKKLEHYTKYVIATTKQVVYEKTLEIQGRFNSEKDEERKKPLLENLILAKENGYFISNYEIESEINTFAFAGSDSTATVMGFVLVCLGVLQDIQDKVYNELFNLFGDSDRECTLDDIILMTYLERTIKETMRLFAPAPLISRTITQNIKLDSMTIPPGTYCLCGIFAMSRSPEIYPDPLKFDPNRFTPEEIAKRHPASFIPFGAGPRNCVGLKFAYMSMKVILSTILRKYRIYSDVDLENIKLKMEIFLKPTHGYRIRLEPRTP